MSKAFISDASATFYTTGDGLRGVPVLVMDKDDGTLQWARVHSNSGTRLKFDTPLTTAPLTNDAYYLGSIPMTVESGDLTFGSPNEIKSIHSFLFHFERGSRGILRLNVASDQASQTSTAWQRAGSVPMKGRTEYRLSMAGISGATGRTIRYQLLGIEPGQIANITHMTIVVDEEANFAR